MKKDKKEPKTKIKSNKNSLKITLILIISLIFVLGTILIVYLAFFHNKNNPTNKQDESKVIVEQKRYLDYTYEDSFNNYLFVDKDRKMGAIDKDGNVVIDFIYDDSFIAYGQNYVLIQGDKQYLYDANLNFITQADLSLYVTEDLKTHEPFYYLKGKIYNFKNEIIYDMGNDNSNDYYFQKAGNYIITENNIFNLSTQAEIPITSYYIYNDIVYATANNNTIIYVIDLNTNSLTKYDKVTSRDAGYSLLDEDKNEYILLDYIGLYKKSERYQIDDYQFDFSTCDIGFKIYNKDNKLLKDKCYDSYYKHDDYGGIIVYNIDDNDESAILYNNQLIVQDFPGTIMGRYIVMGDDYENNSNDYYDIKENKVVHNETCKTTLEYVGNNNYLCQDSKTAFIMDESFNIISKNYNSIICYPDSNYCSFELNGKYGLLHNGEEIIPAIYNTINLVKDKIIGTTLWHIDAFFLEKNNGQNALPKEKINIEIPSPYNSINTDETIKKYNLSYMEKLIKENEELFKKYTYIVDNNNRLKPYQNKVMNLFYELVLNKNYLDEYHFFTSLKDLSIIKKTSLENPDAIGLYYDTFKRIDLLSTMDNVIYHELTHFLDFSINEYYVTRPIYKCHNEYYSNKDYANMDLNDQYSCQVVYENDEEIKFLLEGGAEYFSSYYLNNNFLRTYNLQTNILGALCYIYGFDLINDIYFDNENDVYKLFMLFNDAGLTIDDFKNFIHIEANEEDNPQKFFFITDTLIKLYESKFNTKWYEDKEFSEIITTLVGYREIKSSYTTRYKEYQKLNYDFEAKYKNIIDRSEEIINVLPASYMKTNEGSYYIFSVYRDDKVGYTVVKYDFKNSKVLDKKKIVL